MAGIDGPDILTERRVPLSDQEKPRPEPSANDVEKRPYAPPDIAWIEEVEVRRNLAAACAKADPFRCSDNPSAHLS